jgi:beta-galactosidase
MDKLFRFGITLWVVICLQTAWAVEGVPRKTQLFDFGWRFFRGEAADAQAPGFDDRQWRLLDLPHDWSIEDLPAPPPDKEPRLYMTKGQWRFRRGDDPNWKAADLDEASWEQVTLPAAWEKHSNYTADNVYGWYRRKIIVPESYREQDVVLELGWVDDVDQTYFNGQLVGSTGSFPPGKQRCPVHFGGLFAEPRSDLQLELGDILFDHGPDNVSVDGEIAVNENVAHSRYS